MSPSTTEMTAEVQLSNGWQSRAVWAANVSAQKCREGKNLRATVSPSGCSDSTQLLLKQEKETKKKKKKGVQIVGLQLSTCQTESFFPNHFFFHVSMKERACRKHFSRQFCLPVRRPPSVLRFSWEFITGSLSLAQSKLRHAGLTQVSSCQSGSVVKRPRGNLPTWRFLAALLGKTSFQV